MNPASLPTEQRDERGVLDFLFAVVEVARASRREADSRPLPRLKEPERGHPERNEQQEPPPGRKLERPEPVEPDDRHAQHGAAEVHAPLALARADVTDADLAHGPVSGPSASR